VERVALKAVCAGSQNARAQQRCFYAALRIKRLAVQKKIGKIFVRCAVDIHARPTLRSVGE